MSLLARYVIRQFMKPLLFSAVVFGGLVLISEFFRELNFYLEKDTAFTYVFAYLFLNLPWWIIQVLPVAVLLAVLFSLGQLSRHGEITAMKAAGVNLWRLFILFLAVGLAIGAADFFLRENVIPSTVAQAETIRREKIKAEKRPPRTELRDLVVSIPPNSRITIDVLNTRDGTMLHPVLDYYDDDFTLRGQIVAERARWQAGGWLFVNGVERAFDQGRWEELPFEQKTFSLPFAPGDFIVENIRPEQMTSAGFRRYLKRIETLGIPSHKERIQYHLRLSSAFSHIIVMLIGMPFALGMGSRYGKILSFTFALIFSFVYWGFLAVGQSLGENKIISPLLAAWLGNIVFGVAGLYLTGKVPK